MESTPLSDSFGRRERWRLIKDRIVGHAMAIGGVGVIVTIMLIFVYLFYVVLPLFAGASVKPRADYAVPADALAGPVAHVALDEYAEVALAVGTDGRYLFMNATTGRPLVRGEVFPGGGPREIVALAASEPDSRVFAIADAAGEVAVVRHDYDISFPNDVRRVEPKIARPLGDTLLPLGLRATELAVAATTEEVTVVGADDADRLVMVHAARSVSFLDESVTVETRRFELPYDGAPIAGLALDVDQRELFVADTQGWIHFYDVQRKDAAVLADSRQVVENDADITALAFLSGGISLLVGDSSGTVAQWFPVRNDDNEYRLERVRTFADGDPPIRAIAPEYYRKGFAALNAANRITLYHATADQRLARLTVPGPALTDVAFAPRANTLVAVDEAGRIATYTVDNEHPEVSFQSLWSKVWYESRAGPEFIWQSSAASSDFEPKFSLTPLTFGTLKAAFYAMLFAVPFAIFGAIYTAYFMTPRMRHIVKPSIEVMEALPTVILGFLAGLWLAPLVERNLPGVLMLVVVLPLFVVGASFLWHRLPETVRFRVPDGWEAALLIPVVLAAVAAALSLSRPVEMMFFGGDMPNWLAGIGIDYDQRNSLVVGLAMGFAVIPTIFSISEDAVFSVPRHLTFGSLALGATPWQTVIRVVILTASPGIFSAVMIGLGRAVGETMIVLMATGNTPIMDANIFQGFRALSANIAVEMPESEVDSTHYRILFLAALVLFLVTFAVNTAAELVRQRLRERYSSL